MRAYNFGVKGSNLTKLFRVTYRKAGIRIWVQLFRGLHPENLGGPKTFKIRRDFGQLQTLIANISGTDGDIDNRKTTLSTTTFLRSTNKWCPLATKFSYIIRPTRNHHYVRGVG